MFRFKDAVLEPGGEITITCNIFDLVAAANIAMSLTAKLQDAKEANPEAWKILGVEGRLEDAISTYQELDAIVVKRNNLFDEARGLVEK